MSRVQSEIIAFDEEALTESLERLDVRGRVAFASACAERLRRAYLAFAQESENAREYARLLDRLWADIEGDRAPEEDVKAAVDQAIAMIPDADDDTYDPYAEDACAALSYAWGCRATGESQEAAWAARRAYEAVDQFVIRRDGIDIGEPRAEGRILEHPLVQAELARQMDDLRELARLDGGPVAQLRARAECANPFADDPGKAAS